MGEQADCEISYVDKMQIEQESLSRKGGPDKSNSIVLESSQIVAYRLVVVVVMNLEEVY